MEIRRETQQPPVIIDRMELATRSQPESEESETKREAPKQSNTKSTTVITQSSRGGPRN